MSDTTIQMVVLDWGGTAVDHGCFAPVRAFVDVFHRYEVDITVAEARIPMGLHKRDHIRALLEMPRIGNAWRETHGRDWSDEDVDALYAAFTPLQVEHAIRHSDVVPDLMDCVQALEESGIRIGTSTGYPREVAAPIFENCLQVGFQPHHNVCADEVPAGRPAPWMIFRNMEALGVFPPHRVIKVGDTVPDILAGRNGGVWSVGVTGSSSEVGLTVDELKTLSAEDRHRRLNVAAETFRKTGAHAVINTLAELPSLIEFLNSRQADISPMSGWLGWKST